MQEYKVKHSSKLLEYLINDLHFSRNTAKKLLKQVTINDKHISQFDYELNIDDVLVISNEIENNKRNIEIIYEDDELITINKPSNLLSISTDKEKDNTAYKMVMDYLKQKDKHNKVFVLHRIDKDTSGVLVFAKNEKIKKLLQDNWNDIVKSRRYYSIIEGHLEKKEDVIINYLKENSTHLVYVDHKYSNESKKAITEYKVLKENGNYSLLDINIKTGRRNQIRATFSDLGHPIVGDEKYNNKDNKRLLLHAYELSFIHPINKKEYVFKTDLPKSFKI